MSKKKSILRVLVACEESQTATIAFRSLGHDAFSCDLKPCSGGHPEWHLLGDALSFIYDDWDLIIAHPPCTYLTKASSTSMFPHGILNESRFDKAMLAKEFFMKFYNCSCPYVAIENPTPLKCVGLPPYSQVIQPYEFGDPYSKRTLLWLKNLPPLFPTLFVVPQYSWVAKYSSPTKRSKSFNGIAAAMAAQWSNFILSDLL